VSQAADVTVASSARRMVKGLVGWETQNTGTPGGMRCCGDGFRNGGGTYADRW
jgi:hypothetical protein